MLIRNSSALACTRMRRDALSIVSAGIDAVLPKNLMRDIGCIKNTLIVRDRRFRFNRLFVIGAGKASAGMAEQFSGVKHATSGVINSVASGNVGNIRMVKAGHPFPDGNGLNRTKEMLALREAYSIGRDDLVLCLLSGGGSSMLVLPADGLNLRDLQQTSKLLIGCGASIQDMNTVRRHISNVKGGQLAKHFAPAKIVTVIISDVIRGRLRDVASGPTSPDTTTFLDARSVLKRFRIWSKVPLRVRSRIEAGCNREIPDTPSSLANTTNIIIGDNRIALDAMLAAAKKFGYTPKLLTSFLAGDAHDAARKIMRNIPWKGHALIFGGETTVVLPKHHGIGGRNREVMAAALDACPQGKFCMLSVASDGIDFKKYAGALIDDEVCRMARGIDVRSYIRRCDSGTLFKRLGTSILTGPTGTNVCDLGVVLT